VIASIESQLGGQAEFDWLPEGLVCRLTVPLPQRQFAADPVSLIESAADDGEIRLGSRSSLR
jgi:hypothetical protein